MKINMIEGISMKQQAQPFDEDSDDECWVPLSPLPPPSPECKVFLSPSPPPKASSGDLSDDNDKKFIARECGGKQDYRDRQYGNRCFDVGAS